MMRLKFTILVIVLLLAVPCFAGNTQYSLSFSTYLGSSGTTVYEEQGRDVVSDSDGNVYISGSYSFFYILKLYSHYLFYVPFGKPIKNYYFVYAV